MASMAALSIALGACASPHEGDRGLSPLPNAQQNATARAAFIEALKPKTPRPVVAVVALNEGTETTDFLVPHAVLQRADVATVVAVAAKRGRVDLMPALAVNVESDFASFDQQFPKGADYVIVPAMHRPDDPQVLAWVGAQARKGAVVMGVCSGAMVLGHAGLLASRQFTGHWYDRNTLKKNPQAVYVPHRRYLFDRAVVTTTGVSASVPVSLAMVEAIGGPAVAAKVAQELGVKDWGPAHDSTPFKLGASEIWVTTKNTLLFWRHETIGIRVEPGVDAVRLALAADAWSRTYRSTAIAQAATEQPVRLDSGLLLIPASDTAKQTVSRHVALAGQAKPVCQLDHTLQDIRQVYGPATTDWVATQLEYGERARQGQACF
nr:DJ-1/PfpI family protein [uncultured Rhodoferax sp.]